jgi:putative ABC transport system permease protein
MLQNYLTVAFRMLARDRLYSAINIVGLAVGFASAILVALFIRDEHSYNRFLPDYQRIYRIYAMHKFPSDASLEESSGTLVDVADWLKLEFPNIESVTRLIPDVRSIRHGDVETEEQITWVDPDFFRVFQLPIVAGDPRSGLAAPDGIVVTRAIARKYFGRDDPIGESLELDRKTPFRVTAVIQDMPAATHLKLNILVPIQSAVAARGDTQVPTYLKLSEHGSAAFIEQHLDEAIARRESLDVSVEGKGSFKTQVEFHMHLLPIGAVHLHRVAGGGIFEVRPDRDSLYGLGAIGALILFVASLNYVNLMSARAARRAVEVGVRKASGATRRNLVLQFMGESLLYMLLALIAAHLIVEIALPSFNAYLRRHIELAYPSDPLLGAAVLMAAALTGVLASAYPAFVLSAFRPAAVLTGHPIQWRGSGFIRQGLVVIQFATLIGLIIGALVIYRQVNFAMNEGLRLDQDQVVVLRTSCGAALKHEVQSLPGVQAVACSSAAPLTVNAPSGGALVPNGSGVRFQLSMVDFQFFELYGLKPIAGRLFDSRYGADSMSAESPSESGSAVIINDELRRQLGIRNAQEAIGLTLNQIRPMPTGPIAMVSSKIIGVVRDFPFGSLTEPLFPVCFYIDPSRFQLMSVKLRGHAIPETLAGIDRVWRRVGEPRPLDRFFLEQHTQELYASITQMNVLLAVAAGLALFIGCLGLFGLSTFTVERRTKEIGVRKALGAARSDIIGMLLWEFSRPVLFANVLAWPICVYLMYRWLQQFVYRIDLSPWMFAAVGATALLIAWLTVIGHTLRLASARPVSALRYE